MAYENIILEKADGIAVITINRPKVLNALNTQTMEEIDAALDDIKADGSIKGFIVTGDGEKSFVAGADIGVLVEQTPVGGKDYSLWGQGILTKLERLGKPSVAAINGFALGGGCELALACTVRFASENALIGLPEVSLGIIPGYGGTQRLARLIGQGRALELIISAGKVDAKEAERIGLVNKVFPQAELLDEAKKYLGKVFRNGPIAVRYAMEAVHEGLDMPFDEGSFLEATLFGLICASEDTKEGLSAFLEKRKPVFKGR